MAQLNVFAAAILVVTLGVAASLADAQIAALNGEKVILVNGFLRPLDGPARVIAVRVFQPRVFGGIMIRGHCGQMLVAHSLARVTVSEIPSDVYSEPSEEGAPWSHGEADGASKSLESFFSLSHPLALFREDPSELDRWHNARVRALHAIQSQMFKQAFLLGDEQGAEAGNERPALETRELDASSDSVTESAEAQAGDPAYSENVAAAATRVEQSEADMARSLAADLAEDNTVGVAQAEPGLLEGVEWTPVNVAGAVLLGVGSGLLGVGSVLLGVGSVLLVVMLLMSLSTLIYGCAEAEPEPLIYVADDTVETPLLKGNAEESAHVEGTSMVNPLVNYVPPQEGKH